MAHMVGMTGPDRSRSLTVALNPTDVRAMSAPLRALSPADREAMAQAAFERWGFCGVGIRRAANQTDDRRSDPTDTHPDDPTTRHSAADDSPPWVGVILITPQEGLPPFHPLTPGGLDTGTAGLGLVSIARPAPTLIIGKLLCVGLCRRLRPLVGHIEAQAGIPLGPASPLAPPPGWLRRMGFNLVRYPVNRYRLDLTQTAPWLQRQLQWCVDQARVRRPNPAPGAASSW